MEINKDNSDLENITFDTLPAAVEVILKTVKRLEAEIIDIKERLSVVSNENYKENHDELLTFDEAVKFLKITSSTLHRWKREGIIPYRKIGTKKYYKKSDLEEYNKIEIKKPKGLRRF